MGSREAEARNIYRLLDAAFGEKQYPPSLGYDLDCLRWNHPLFVERLEAVLGSDKTLSRDEMELFLGGVRDDLRTNLRELADDVCSQIDQLLGCDDDS